ncbi:unnamed protein product, partial [Mesorhabditis belari]|uniref:Eukaryotic translation initiation factor 4E transporter n=1 Tax=Mesorhabditis belari TaxID=2138241 RepID=A0AAF3E877_9BILA
MQSSGENSDNGEGSSQFIPDNMHPLVTSLLERNYIERNPENCFVYDRDEMIRLSKVELSVTRPLHFAEEFNGDDGKFSPAKWMQHLWDQQDNENKSAKKIGDTLKAETSYEDGAILSPQRRGFSGGCCPPDEKSDRVNSDGNRTKTGNSWTPNDGKTRWNEDRKGADDKKKNKGEGDDWKLTRGRSWRDSDEKGKQDFKLPFQKASDKLKTNANQTSSSWKNSNSTQKDFRPAFGRHKDFRGNNVGGDERLPEWVEDGPSTMDDVIELKGFEDSATKRKIPKQEMPAPLSVKTELDGQKSGEQLALPETDAEFAAILGLCDEIAPQKTDISAQSESNATSGSRLSRFFKKPNVSTPNESNQDIGQKEAQKMLGDYSGNDSQGTKQQQDGQEKSILKELFGNKPSGSNEVFARPQLNEGQGIKVSDLERKLHSGNAEKSITRPSGGEDSWAEKVRHLSLDSQNVWGEDNQPSGSPHQDRGSRMTPPNVIPPEILTGPVKVNQLPGLEWEHIPVEKRYLMQHIYQTALVEAANSRGCVPPPEIVDQIRQASILRVMMPNIFYRYEEAQNSHSYHQRPPESSNTYPESKMIERQTEQNHESQATTLIPASVARHMKSNEQEEKNQMIVSHPEGNERNFENPEKPQVLPGLKMDMQGSYQTVLGSMGGGYAMSTYQTATPAQSHFQPNTMQQLPTYQQQLGQYAVMQHHMMIAQAQQQQQQQTQAMLMMQARQLLAQQQLQQQQQQQRNPEISSMVNQHQSRSNENFAPPQNAPSHLERLLANAGIHPTNQVNKVPASGGRAMTLEELERQLTQPK